ncbi:MAG: type II toxin-antitoxin system HicB family antitoxin [Nitrososphaerota archaeon]
MRYRFLVVYEQGDHNYSAYVPDLPGCVSTGVTLGEAREHIREAIAFHLAGMREDGEDIPVTDPAEVAEYLEVEINDPASVSGS